MKNAQAAAWCLERCRVPVRRCFRDRQRGAHDHGGANHSLFDGDSIESQKQINQVASIAATVCLDPEGRMRWKQKIDKIDQGLYY
ncbi:hypothetical protein [Propionimicrobium lymphophilum]|uniref:hypothetical protein n=1 Tax=Propionimicrobium lymphophilum TaxID=33012 RepID=UPI00039E9937|nr:hypothetical protein [Propionimicrobium lymphophilum]